jgi:hypothetical protein
MGGGHRTATVVDYGVTFIWVGNALEAHWVLERSDIGQAEIAHRTLRLPMTVRAVLLMVDGKSEVTQLQRKMHGLANGMQTLESLLANGLIRRRHFSSEIAMHPERDLLGNSARITHQLLHHAAHDSTRVSALTHQTSPTPALAKVVGKQRRSLALARMYLLDQMERMFGDSSEAARNLLRSATTREELMAAFNACREILVETGGLERAQRIETEFIAMLPEAVSN